MHESIFIFMLLSVKISSSVTMKYQVFLVSFCYSSSEWNRNLILKFIIYIDFQIVIESLRWTNLIHNFHLSSFKSAENVCLAFLKVKFIEFLSCFSSFHKRSISRLICERVMVEEMSNYYSKWPWGFSSININFYYSISSESFLVLLGAECMFNFFLNEKLFRMVSLRLGYTTDSILHLTTRYITAAVIFEKHNTHS